MDLFSLPYGLSEDQYVHLPDEPSLDLEESLTSFGPLALAETHRYQQEPSQPDPPPLESAQSGVASLEDQIQRLEGLVEGLGAMLDMVKAQVRTVRYQSILFHGCGSRLAIQPSSAEGETHPDRSAIQRTYWAEYLDCRKNDFGNRVVNVWNTQPDPLVSSSNPPTPIPLTLSCLQWILRVS